MVWFFIILLIIAVAFALYEIYNLKRKNSEIELRLNMLLQETGKTELSTDYVSDELKKKLLELKASGNFIEAVKQLRKCTTFDLYKAKKYIEDLK